MIDHGRFFEQVYVFCLINRLALVWNVATDEGYARTEFKAYSASARWRVIQILLTELVAGVTPQGEAPATEKETVH